MPTYEYRCENCSREFETRQSITGHASDRVTCPGCGSDHVVPQLAAFSAKTSRKS